MTYANLAPVFEEKAWGEDNSDGTKLMLLYYLYMGLLGSNNRKLVSQKVLQLVDHVDGFNAYLGDCEYSR